MKYKFIEPDATNQFSNLNASNLVKKVLAFHHCTEQQLQELFDQETSLRESQSPIIKRITDRILKAKDNKEKIFIGGDYDADGVCATTIMVDTLNRLGIEHGYYIPNRFKDGYGLNVNVVQQAHLKGYSLIITVDNGVKAYEACHLAAELGIEVIILDHHELEELPEHYAILHPDYLEDQFRGLSGAGVTLQVARSLVKDVNLHNALAAVATIGDVMSVWGENKRIIRCGLKLINENKVPHLTALLDAPHKLNTEKDLAFQIVPKINAIGRLQEFANPNNVVKYFLQNNPQEIQKFASQMIHINNQRKEMTLQMNVLAEKKDLSKDFIVLHDERFHEGLVGLLAGKIANKYNKPTLIFKEGEDVFKGSGRSAQGFDLYTFFQDGFDEFASFGGHRDAIGCSIEKSNFPGFLDKVALKFSDISFDGDVQKEVCCLQSEDVTIEAVEEYLQLGPFGQGFKEVPFAISGLKVKSKQLIKGKFLKYTFENKLDSIWFDYDGITEFNEGDVLIGELAINEFNGQKKCSLMIQTIWKQEKNV